MGQHVEMAGGPREKPRMSGNMNRRFQKAEVRASTYRSLLSRTSSLAVLLLLTCCLSPCCIAQPMIRRAVREQWRQINIALKLEDKGGSGIITEEQVSAVPARSLDPCSWTVFRR